MRAVYSDLPLWDIVFGTFRNPEGFQAQQGFYEGASARIPEMLLFRDVTAPAPVEGAQGAGARAAA